MFVFIFYGNKLFDHDKRTHQGRRTDYADSVET